MYARPVLIVPLPSAPMSQWNFANVWEAVAATHPDDLALAQGPTRRTWQEFERRADALAVALVSAGLGQQAKVAQYLYNGSGVPGVDLCCLQGRAGSGQYQLPLYRRRTSLPVGQRRRRGGGVPRRFRVAGWMACGPGCRAIRTWLWVDDGSGPCPPVGHPVRAGGGVGPVRRGHKGRGDRSPDDLVLLYTGGTTGMPKGVMWRQDDLFAVLNRMGELRYRGDGDPERDPGRRCRRRPSTLRPGSCRDRR